MTTVSTQEEGERTGKTMVVRARRGIFFVCRRFAFGGRDGPGSNAAGKRDTLTDEEPEALLLAEEGEEHGRDEVHPLAVPHVAIVHGVREEDPSQRRLSVSHAGEGL